MQVIKIKIFIGKLYILIFKRNTSWKNFVRHFIFGNNYQMKLKSSWLFKELEIDSIMLGIHQMLQSFIIIQSLKNENEVNQSESSVVILMEDKSISKLVYRTSPY